MALMHLVIKFPAIRDEYNMCAFCDIKYMHRMILKLSPRKCSINLVSFSETTCREIPL